MTIIIPLAAGTGMDGIARLYGEALAKSWGVPVVVENRPGAAMIVGVNGLMAAPADGHTMLVATPGPLSINPAVFKKLPYDYRKDLIPVAMYAKSPFVLVVNPAMPVKSAAELVQYVKARPGKLNFSIVNISSTPHLITEMFNGHFALKVQNVVYKNSGQAIMDVTSGVVDLGLSEVGAAIPLIESGKVRALAVSSNTRVPSLPDVPTMAEVMGNPKFEAVSWHMLLVRAGTAPGAVKVLHDSVKRVTNADNVKALMVRLGYLPIDTPSLGALGSLLESEAEKWGGIARRVGLAGSQ